MSKIQKSNLTLDGNSVHMSMPFAKVDKSKRLVHGFATLDNIDTQGDVVTAEASAKAFARARGNIREMHQPVAVGKMVGFQESEYFDVETNSLYRGIYVTARVSKGAEDTWEKVLDETLTGFSIGGEVTKSRTEFMPDADGGKGRVVKIIEDYDLVELSLVDNPANQLANVFSIEKTAGSVKVNAGEVVDAKIENVFFCDNGHEDSVILIDDNNSTECPECGISMKNIGWFESGPDKAEKVSNIVAKFKTPEVQESAPDLENKRGVENMSKASESKSVEINPEVEDKKDEAIEEASTESNEIAEVVNEETGDIENIDETEGVDSEEKVLKKIDELHESVQKSLTESKEETLAKVSELEGKIQEAQEAFLEKASELESKYNEFGEKFELSKQRLLVLESQFEKINSADAVKKSAGLDQSTGRVEQKPTSFWGNAFSG